MAKARITAPSNHRSESIFLANSIKDALKPEAYRVLGLRDFTAR